MKRIEIKPKYGIIALLFILLLAYALYEARAVILGPRISISNPVDGETLEDPVITMEGKAQNVAWLSLNGRQIFTDEEGHWSEKLILSPGLSIMTVSGRDRFGRERQKSVRIYLRSY